MRKKKFAVWMLAGVMSAALLAGCAQVSVAVEAGDDGEMTQQETEEHVSNFQKTDGVSKESRDEVADVDAIRFTTVDLDGAPVTGDVFQDADLTLVCVWATYCGPCISEMPDLEDLYENLPDNVNQIGLVIDVEEGDKQAVQAAKDIVNDTGVKYRNLCLSESILPVIMDMQFTPSAFFVDRQGRMVGELMDGVHYPDIVERLLELTE